jgi:hypothetical protein
MPSFCTSTGILPTACVASVKNRTPCFLAMAAISLIGCTLLYKEDYLIS